MIQLRELDASHVAAHNAGEDAEIIRWLSEVPSTTESTRNHFALLARNAERGLGKQGYGIWLDDRLAGYIDFELDAEGVPERGDVNLAYAVHPWARRRGVATEAVELICALLVDRRIGRRAVIRTDTGNRASAAVARRCGFTLIGSADLPLWVRQLTA